MRLNSWNALIVLTACLPIAGDEPKKTRKRDLNRGPNQAQVRNCLKSSWAIGTSSRRFIHAPACLSKRKAAAAKR